MYTENVYLLITVTSVCRFCFTIYLCPCEYTQVKIVNSWNLMVRLIWQEVHYSLIYKSFDFNFSFCKTLP